MNKEQFKMKFVSQVREYPQLFASWFMIRDDWQKKVFGDNAILYNSEFNLKIDLIRNYANENSMTIDSNFTEVDISLCEDYSTYIDLAHPDFEKTACLLEKIQFTKQEAIFKFEKVSLSHRNYDFNAPTRSTLLELRLNYKKNEFSPGDVWGIQKQWEKVSKLSSFPEIVVNTPFYDDLAEQISKNIPDKFMPKKLKIKYIAYCREWNTHLGIPLMSYMVNGLRKLQLAHTAI